MPHRSGDASISGIVLFGSSSCRAFYSSVKLVRPKASGPSENAPSDLTRFASSNRSSVDNPSMRPSLHIHSGTRGGVQSSTCSPGLHHLRDLSHRHLPHRISRISRFKTGCIKKFPTIFQPSPRNPCAIDSRILLERFCVCALGCDTTNLQQCRSLDCG